MDIATFSKVSASSITSANKKNDSIIFTSMMRMVFDILVLLFTIILKCDIHNRTDIKEGEVYER